MEQAKCIHPFEAAGLGRAPFRFVGLDYRVGPIKIAESGGCETLVGSPGQPMGCCKYCGQGIAEICIIEDADRKTFEVGNVCVGKVDARLGPIVDRQVKKAARLRREERAMKRIDAAAEALTPEVEAILAQRPHPYTSMAREGHTLFGYVSYLFANGGTTGRTRAARIVEDVLRTLHREETK